MTTRSRTRPVVLAVSSSGGHWVQMQRLAPAFTGAEVHYATTDATAAGQSGDNRVHVFPDANAAGMGEDPQWLYSIGFEASELFGEDAETNSTVMIDCWEPYLERA